ncbi:MAG TPA: PorV/PorQ family protein [Flavobacteriales bacterium]|nr:PorV/PorQ family protein [Flavobacteriales bacterium]HPH81128.1 PorV/PorQ family protein [Flavobacteriales bacterium]
MLNIRFLIVLIAIFAQGTTSAQTARKYSNEFLSIGVGARALGMSGAYVSAASDATSGYWNPAGLTGITSKFQGALMHSEYFAGIAKYDYGSLATRLDPKSVMAVSVIRFGVDDIPDTSELIDPNGNINYDRIKSFSAADYGFLFSYARQLKKEGLSVGANAKVIHRKVGDFAKSWGFGLDAGVQYNVGKWRLAAMARDITSTFNAWSYNLSQSQRDALSSTGNEIPENSLEVTLPSLTLGGARKFEFGKRFTLLTELDLQTTFDGMRNTIIRDKTFSMSPVFGLEAGYRNIIFLRGGIGNLQTVQNDLNTGRETTFQPNIGLGIRIKGVQIDYALTDIGDQSTALFSNVFSLRFDINAADKKQNSSTPPSK